MGKGTLVASQFRDGLVWVFRSKKAPNSGKLRDFQVKIKLLGQHHFWAPCFNG